MQPTTKSSMSVKDKLEGNKLDLSLLEITDVPVKEMVRQIHLFNLVVTNHRSMV